MPAGSLGGDRGEEVERAGVEQRVPARDRVDRFAAENALDGASSFFPVSVRGIAGTARIVSGTWRGESCDRRSLADRVAQLVVEHDAVGEHDEQHELAGASLVVLEVDDEAVHDLRQLLDDAVELAGAETDAAAVEGGVRAAGDDAAAALGEADPVALAPDSREHLEVRGAVERAVRRRPTAQPASTASAS